MPINSSFTKCADKHISWQFHGNLVHNFSAIMKTQRHIDTGPAANDNYNSSARKVDGLRKKTCEKMRNFPGILFQREFPINSLWPSDVIWWHRSGSTLAQVMACCLMAPSHYLSQCLIIILNSSDIHPREISQEIPQASITKMSFKISYLKFSTNLPGACELIISLIWMIACPWIAISLSNMPYITSVFGAELYIWSIGV